MLSMIRVHYKPSRYSERIGWFRNIKVFKDNFSETISEAKSIASDDGVSSTEFEENFVDMINRYAPYIDIEVIKQ